MYFVWMNSKWIECHPESVEDMRRCGYDVIQRDEPPRGCAFVYDYKPNVYEDDHLMPYFKVGMEVLERYLAAL